MSCLLTNHIERGCRDGIGGIDTVYLANKELVSGVTSSDMLISGITTVDGLGASAAAFYKFEVNRNTSSWTDTPTPVASNGGTIYVPSVTMVFTKNEADKANTIKLMGQSTLVAIIKETSGKYFLLGEEFGLDQLTGSYNSGVNRTDLNGWTLTLSSAGENGPSKEVDSSVMDSSILVA